ncbi:MAG TPA: hypothetical protein VFG79_01980 [Solirubrobacter sp.]|nr:hypothetical protein [Solirubrobacter sp.]
MTRFLVALCAAAATAAATAAPARADVHYGGAAVKAGKHDGPGIALVLHDSGRVAGRVSFTYDCGRKRVYNVVVRVRGRAQGAAFTAGGHTRVPTAGRVRFRLSGTLAPDSATGKLRMHSRCRNPTRAFVLRSLAAPAGAPALPPRSTLFYGLTGQTAGGVHLPLTIRVAGNGRVLPIWFATMRCGRATLSVGNDTPATTVEPDGTFSRSERYTVRLSDGMRETYRVKFSGRFLADGAVGTLRARMRARKDGRRYVPCDSGVQTWTARP